MDRRTLLAVVLSLGIYSAWLAWRGPTKPSEEPGGETAGATEPPPAAGAPAPVASAPPAELQGPADLVPVELCGVKMIVSEDGGAISGAELPGVSGPYQVTPVYSWVGGRILGTLAGAWAPYGPDPGSAHVLTVDHARGLEVAVGGEVPRLRVTERGDHRVVLEGRSSGVAVRHELSETGSEPCTVSVSTTFSNPGAERVVGTVSWAVRDHTNEAGSRGTSQHQPTALVDGSLYYGGALGAGCVRAGTQLKDGSAPIDLPGPVSWFGTGDRYFGFYVLPAASQGSLRLERLGEGESSVDGSVLTGALALEPGTAVTWTGRVYAGANHVSTLVAIDPSLDRVVDLGWFAMFGKPLLWVLTMLHGLLGGWGAAIIGVTVLLKLVFLPLTWKAMKSGQAMQVVQPEIARLREKYKDSPEELNRQTLELMSKHGVNPLSGCWPMLVQMPVFVALYNVLLTNVEFYQEPFLYLRDLSSPDPYCALPLAVTALMWGQQQLTPTPENMDPAQQAVLKWMPLLFGLFFFTSPSGLAIYVFVNVSLSILQQWLIKRSLGTGALAPVVPG